jgi:hypothetical protein
MGNARLLRKVPRVLEAEKPESDNSAFSIARRTIFIDPDTWKGLNETVQGLGKGQVIHRSRDVGIINRNPLAANCPNERYSDVVCFRKSQYLGCLQNDVIWSGLCTAYCNGTPFFSNENAADLHIQ